jgi:hypothetical protein
MKQIRKFGIALVVLGVLAVMVVPAFAQNTGTMRTTTLTEEQINESFRVTNPLGRRVSDVVVDLQPGQAVVSAKITDRRQKVTDVVGTFVPSVRNGRIYWEVSFLTANGEPVSADLLAQINASIATSWRNYIKGKASTGRISALEITETEAVITWMPGRRP